MFRRSLFVVAICALAAMPLAFSGQARAQSDEDDDATRIDSPVRARINAARRADAARKARAKGEQPGEAPATPEQVPALYPGAVRVEPPAKASKAATPTLQKIVAAYDIHDAASVVALTTEVLANTQANDYDRSFAAKMAGIALVGTDKGRAAQYLAQALQFNGLNNNEHYEAMIVLAQLQLQAKQYPEALVAANRFFDETHSQKPEYLALKGNALYRLKRYPEAVTVLKQAIAATPEPNPDWLQLLMGTYVEMGQPAEAAKVAEMLGTKTPQDEHAQMNLAAVYMKGGQNDKAAAILEKLRVAGQLTDAQDYRNLYALYLNMKGREKDAAGVINEGLQKNILSADYPTYSALAEANYFAGQTGPAIDAYRKAAPLAPDGEAYLNLAKVLLNEGQVAEAKQAAKQALDKGLKNPADARKILSAGGK